MKLYASATGCSSILNINVSESHGSSVATATVQCKTTSLDIGSSITIDLGYTTGHGVLFNGYVKQIEWKVPDNTYVITANDVLVRAIDYFIVSDNPDSPFSRSNITGEDLVRDVLALAGISNYSYQATSFTFAINNPAEVNLVSSYDYSKMIADIIAWNLWCDRNGVTNFRNRKPYVMYGTSGQPGDVADVPIAGVEITDKGSNRNVLNFTYKKSEKDLRNRVVVYGSSGIYASASASSPYLPAGFYKTAAVGSEIIDSQGVAQDAANYNLARYNRLGRQVSTSVLGDYRLEARKTVHVDENYTSVHEDMYIYTCEHAWSSSGYITNMELRGT